MLKSRYIRGSLGQASPGHVPRPPSAGAALAPPGSPVIWFDFSDLSTLFQDATAETPVTAAEQNIAAAVNKGSLSATLDSIGVEGGGGAAPTYETDAVVGAALFVDESPSLLWGNPEVSHSTHPNTWAAVFRSSTNGQQQCVVSLGTAAGIDLFANPEVSYDTLTGATENDLLTTSLDANVWAAAIHTSTETDQDLYLSTVEAVTNVEADLTIPYNLALDSSWVIGAAGDTGVTPWDGYIGEVFVWDGVLSAGEIATFQSYTQGKYGIVWV